MFIDDFIADYQKTLESEYVKKTGFKKGGVVYLLSDQNRTNPLTVTGFETDLSAPGSIDVLVLYTTTQRIVNNDYFPFEALTS
jgi:hypothetical protein